MRRRAPDEITRSFRISRKEWEAAMTKANEKGVSLSEEIREFLRRYAK